MNYRPAKESDLPCLVSMADQAIAYFRASGAQQKRAPQIHKRPRPVYTGGRRRGRRHDHPGAGA